MSQYIQDKIDSFIKRFRISVERFQIEVNLKKSIFNELYSQFGGAEECLRNRKFEIPSDFEIYLNHISGAQLYFVEGKLCNGIWVQLPIFNDSQTKTVREKFPNPYGLIWSDPEIRINIQHDLVLSIFDPVTKPHSNDIIFETFGAYGRYVLARINLREILKMFREMTESGAKALNYVPRAKNDLTYEHTSVNPSTLDVHRFSNKFIDVYFSYSFEESIFIDQLEEILSLFQERR